MVVKILKYEFSNFWWGFKVTSLLAWPGYLPITLPTLGLLVTYLIGFYFLSPSFLSSRIFYRFYYYITRLLNSYIRFFLFKLYSYLSLFRLLGYSYLILKVLNLIYLILRILYYRKLLSLTYLYILKLSYYSLLLVIVRYRSLSCPY